MLPADENEPVQVSPNSNFAGDIVELVVYTSDEAFLQTLRDAVGEARRLWHVPSAAHVSDLLLAGQVGILVLDVQSQPDAGSVFIVQIKRQFPDLVIVVSGSREAEAPLARLISDGLVYRFIHKPMSPERAKLFADAAVKKYADHRRSRPAPPEPVRRDRRQFLWVGWVMGAVLVATLLSAWALRHRFGGAAPPTTPPDIPIPEQAVPMPQGPGELQERLMAEAESALLEERLDEAATAIEAARKAGVDGGRISFLASQLAKRREQHKRPAGVAKLKPDDHPSAPAAIDDGLKRILTLAAVRIKEGHLAEPDGDSARFYVGEALRLDPQSDATQAAREALARELLAGLRYATERKDFSRAAVLLEAAEGVAAPSNVDIGRQLLKTAQDRLPQDRPIEPAKDGAGEAALAGNAAPETSALPREPDEGAVQPRLPTQPIDARQLKLVKSVNPAYPPEAARTNTEGWVEVDFTVTENGEVRDISVHAANPPGVFDGAAVNALSRWRYQPVLKDAKPVTQRARIRIRFALAG